MDHSTYDVRSRHWAEMIRQCNASGLTKKEWCRQNGISIKTFYYRQRQLRNEVYCAQTGNTLPESTQTGRTEFAEVVLPSSGQAEMPKPSDFRPDAVIRTRTMTIEVSGRASKEVLRLIRTVVNHAS